MKLIADSGSTKTAWCLVGNNRKYMMTQGINPYQQTEEEIAALLHSELNGQLADDIDIDEVWFYGAGCTKEKSPVVASAIRGTIAPNARISVSSDMLGAARALCGDSQGIVCILGTGSNSCLYDGKDMVKNVSPLGFILGDEGSGAYIGKRLVGDVLKRQMADDICTAFFEETHETNASIIQKVYRESFPNRYLASLSPFCARHREHPDIHALLIDCFKQFFIRNINAYGTTDKVHFVGSIAYYYKNEITEAATQLGYDIGNILQAPLEGLVNYHSK